MACLIAVAAAAWIGRLLDDGELTRRQAVAAEELTKQAALLARWATAVDGFRAAAGSTGDPATGDPTSRELVQRGALDDELKELQSDAGVVCTLLDARGRVLHSSGRRHLAEPSAVDPEVALAVRTKQPQHTTRYSELLGEAFVFVAWPVLIGDDVVGLARCSRAVAGLAPARGGVLWPLFWFTTALLVCFSLLRMRSAKRTASSLRQIRGGVSRMLAGNLDARISATQEDRDVSELAAAFNSLATDLQLRIGTITEDRNRLQAILDGMVEGLIAVDERSHVLHMNGVAVRLLDATGVDPNGRPLWEVTRHALLLEALERCLSSRVRQDFELSVGSGTSARIVEVRMQPLVAQDDALQGAVLVLHEVSQLRRLESVRRDFVANVSHEMKTPLAAIQGLCETLEDDPEMLRETRQSFLGRIGAQTERLKNIVNELLELSRIESSAGHADLGGPCDVRAPLRESVQELMAKAEAKDQTLALELPGEALVVRADQEVIRHVVDNLVDNAIKYTPRQGCIQVRACRVGAEVEIAVRDDGVGMEPQDRDRAFERFYRADKARSGVVEGTGLGLSIVKNVTLRLGGSVRVESAPGRGSHFIVRLPEAGDTVSR